MFMYVRMSMLLCVFGHSMESNSIFYAIITVVVLVVVP